MNIELTKEQAQMGDDFLKKLLSDGVLERQCVYDFFGSKGEAVNVCTILQQIGIIIFNSPTYNDKFMLIVPGNGISTFLKNGGLTKIATESEKQDIIREKDDMIRDLTAENLKFQNRQLKRAILYSMFGFFAGAVIDNLNYILKLLNLKS